MFNDDEWKLVETKGKEYIDMKGNIVGLLVLESKNRIVGTTYEINDGKIVVINEKSRRIILSESNS